MYKIEELCEILETKKGKLDLNMKEGGISPTPDSTGTGGAHEYLRTDLYHLALFFVLQLDGVNRDVIASMLKKRPLHGLSEKELQRITYIVHQRRGKMGRVDHTESLEIVPYTSIEDLIHPGAFRICFLINFGKIKRVIDARCRALGL